VRISYLLTASLERPYGLGRCFPLARQVAAAGHEVHIIALHHDWSSATTRSWAQDGVTVHYVGQMHVRKAGGETVYFGPVRLLWLVLKGALAMTRRALTVPADLYHIGKPHPQNSLAGLWAGRRRGRPVFLDCDDYEAMANRFGGRWQRRGLAWLEDTMPRRVQGVTVNTRFLARRCAAQGVPESRILHLPNGVDRRRFAALSPSEVDDWRDKLDLPGRPVIAYVGTMSLVNHPVDLLLTAFALLARRDPRPLLLLVGNGPDLPQLQAQAAQLGIVDRCRFAGHVAPDQVSALLSLAQVSVDPVHDDPVARARWPLKIMESLALGVPIVTGDVGDRAEMVGYGRAGLVVAPGDPQALANGLAEALKADRQTTLAEGCRLQAGEYDLTELADRLLAFYQATIDDDK
jgi:glycosyltransferase involved in cell wall biosynthesis